jgi:hypothetical protein
LHCLILVDHNGPNNNFVKIMPKHKIIRLLENIIYEKL